MADSSSDSSAARSSRAWTSPGTIVFGMLLLVVTYCLAMPLILRCADYLTVATGSELPSKAAFIFYAPVIFLYFRYPLVHDLVEAYAGLFN